MATSGRIETGRRNGTNFYFQWQLAHQDVGANKSIIHWQSGINISGGARWYSNAIRIHNVHINGSGNLASGVWSNKSGGGDHQLASGSIEIWHNGDGTKHFGASMAGWLYGNGDLGTSGGWDLPTIPRASSPTFSKGLYTVGETIAVNMNKKHWSFSHNVSIQIPDGNEIKRQNGFGGDQWVWTPNEAEIAAIYARMTHTQQTSLGVDTDTLNGGGRIGGGFQNVQIRVDADKVRPIFTTIDARDTNPTTKAITGDDRVFIQGLSTVTAKIAAANKMTTRQSATPKRYEMRLADTQRSVGYTAADIAQEMGSPNLQGSQRLVIKAVDSRELSAEATKDLQFIPYEAPKITATAERKNNFENETKLTVSGTFSRITVGGADKNRIEANSLRYRMKQDGGQWSAWVTRTFTQSAGAFSMTTAYLSLANSSQFIIEIEVRDRLKTSTVQVAVDRGVPILMVSSSGRNVGVGKMPVAGRALDVAGSIYMEGRKVATAAAYVSAGEKTSGLIVRNTSLQAMPLNTPHLLSSSEDFEVHSSGYLVVKKGGVYLANFILHTGHSGYIRGTLARLIIQLNVNGVSSLVNFGAQLSSSAWQTINHHQIMKIPDNAKLELFWRLEGSANAELKAGNYRLELVRVL